jgi:prephenate dehydrogenase
MGGSLGLALRALADPPGVVGFDSGPDVARRARERGAVDSLAADPRAAIERADLVFLAAPPRAATGLIDLLEPLLPDGTVVADLSSVMRPLRSHLTGRPTLLRRVVSSHPLCGSERSGIEAARADLYGGRTILVGADDSARGAADRVSGLWRAIGAEPRPIDPRDHDALLALTSHLPYLGSVALARGLGRSGRPPGTLADASGPGLRDATRLAGSLPALWEEILLLNADEVIPALRLLEEETARLLKALETGAPALRALLEEAHAFRADLAR